MANNYVLNAAADVFEQILILELKKKTKKREYWVKKWISRRNTLGASGTLLKELHFEDPRSFCNFLRVDYAMFYELLQKVRQKFIIIIQKKYLFCNVVLGWSYYTKAKYNDENSYTCRNKIASSSSVLSIW